MRSLAASGHRGWSRLLDTQLQPLIPDVRRSWSGPELEPLNLVSVSCSRERGAIGEPRDEELHAGGHDHQKHHHDESGGTLLGAFGHLELEVGLVRGPLAALSFGSCSNGV